jgi:hypothetical protein
MIGIGPARYSGSMWRLAGWDAKPVEDFSPTIVDFFLSLGA